MAKASFDRTDLYSCSVCISVSIFSNFSLYSLYWMQRRQLERKVCGQRGIGLLWLSIGGSTSAWR